MRSKIENFIICASWEAHSPGDVVFPCFDCGGLVAISQENALGLLRDPRQSELICYRCYLLAGVLRLSGSLIGGKFVTRGNSSDN